MTRVLILSFMVTIALTCNETGWAQSIETVLTYQGKLSESGSPATGEYDFEFKLYDGEVSVNQKGPTVNKENVPVSAGAFTVHLDFGAEFNGQERWLEIGVRKGVLADPNVYKILNPRQEVTASPYALYALSGPPVDSSLSLTDAVNDPDAVLMVNNTDYGNAIKAWSSNGNYGFLGNYGVAVSGNHNGGNWGQLGAQSAGVYGNSTNDYGVRGESTNGIGGYFNSSSGYGLVVENGNVGIGTDRPETKLVVVGLTGTTSYNDLRYDTKTGGFYYASSSAKYKEDIQSFNDDFTKILKAQPKSFVDKHSRERNIGFIAEEFDELGLKHLVIYKDDQPDALNYELISLYLLEIVKVHENSNQQLQDQVNALTQRLEDLEAVILK